jgi:hypothetical protein
MLTLEGKEVDQQAGRVRALVPDREQLRRAFGIGGCGGRHPAGSRD